MAVYLVRAGETEFVKIGKADDVPSRLRELQAGNHEVLAVIREIDGGYAEEHWMHKRFAASHLTGEWFRLDPEMLTVEVPDIPQSVPTHRKILDRWPSDTEMAADLKVNCERVRKWRQRRIPSDWWQAIVAASVARGWPVSLGDFFQNEAA